jgi:signal peptidase II
MIKKNIFKYSYVVFIVLVLDLFSKYWVLHNFEIGQSKSIIGNILRITLTRNTGLSFGIFSNQIHPLLATLIPIILIIVFSFFIFKYLKYIRIGTPQTFSWFSIMLLYGSFFGNTIDRIFNGFVTDFIDIGINNIRWYKFNLADLFAVVACFSLIVLFLNYYESENNI